jgi:hypothetical protein
MTESSIYLIAAFAGGYVTGIATGYLFGIAGYFTKQILKKRKKKV